MPFHRIYYAGKTDSGAPTFSREDKKAIAQSITALYGKNLPKFYVVVTFIEVEKEDFYIGGEENNKFVRIISQHLARTNVGEERMNEVLDGIQGAFHPFVRDRGLDWEIHIEETGRASWRENGLAPPLPKTAAEKRWKLEDRASPSTAEENVVPS